MTHSGAALIDPQKVISAIGIYEGMRVADFGCGRTGHFIFLASREVGEKGVVYAMDILKDVLQNIAGRARSEGYHNIQTVWTDMEKFGATPIPENTLDVGFFVNCLYMIKDKNSALREAGRLIRDGGKMAVIDWVRKLGPLGPGEENMVDKNFVVNELKTLGFKLQEDLSCGDHHFCLIFKKNSGGI